MTGPFRAQSTTDDVLRGVHLSGKCVRDAVRVETHPARRDHFGRGFELANGTFG